MTGYTFFEWLTLGIWIVVILVLIYGIIAIHDIPASIAKKRGHPHEDAIEAAGWVSLLTLHALWPFLWIWAMTYDPKIKKKKDEMEETIKKLEARITDLENLEEKKLETEED